MAMAHMVTTAMPTAAGTHVATALVGPTAAGTHVATTKQISGRLRLVPPLSTYAVSSA
jgi:hypothetical protein